MTDLPAPILRLEENFSDRDRRRFRRIFREILIYLMSVEDELKRMTEDRNRWMNRYNEDIVRQAREKKKPCPACGRTGRPGRASGPARPKASSGKIRRSAP